MVHPVLKEQRAQKKREINRSKEIQQANLAQIDPKSIERRISCLTQPHQTKEKEQLQTKLNKILAARKKAGLTNDKNNENANGKYSNDKHSNNQPSLSFKFGKGRPLGMRSIFWDPILNPRGFPPYPYEQVEWDRTKNIKYDEILTNKNDTSYDGDKLDSINIKSIPLPRGPPPLDQRYYPPKPAPKIIYQSAPIIRDLKKEATQMVPNSVKSKLKNVNQYSIQSKTNPSNTVSLNSKSFDHTDDSIDLKLQDIEKSLIHENTHPSNTTKSHELNIETSVRSSAFSPISLDSSLSNLNKFKDMEMPIEDNENLIEKADNIKNIESNEVIIKPIENKITNFVENNITNPSKNSETAPSLLVPNYADSESDSDSESEPEQMQNNKPKEDSGKRKASEIS